MSEELKQKNRENRLSQRGKEMYKRRKETIECSFADSKNNHGYRYAMYKGLKKNQIVRQNPRKKSGVCQQSDKSNFRHVHYINFITI
jgi:hypothetical protein